MLQFVWNKIKNKKWLNLCLLIGIALLIALFVCHPMFEKGADNQVLQRSFVNYAKEKEEFPAIMERNGTYDVADYPDTASIYERLDAYENKWTEYVAVDEVASQRYLGIAGGNVNTDKGGRNLFLSIGLLSGMAEHIEIVQGEDLLTATGDDGVFACLVSESTMDTYGLVVGERLEFPYMTDAAGKPACFKIVGICREADITENYWRHTLTDYEKHIFVSNETFDALMSSYRENSVSFEENLLLNYTQIRSDQAETYADYLQQFRDEDYRYTDNLLETLQNFSVEKKTIRIILLALEAPCIVLLLLFIYMVSTQVLTAEEGEIAVLRSRGATRTQTLLLYLMQSGILVLAGLVIGLGLGYGMCKAAASTDAFLQFVKKDISIYRFTWEMIPYGIAGGMIAILFMTLPVWRRSKATIVEQKSANHYSGRRPFWERYFLDVLLLVISGYFLYNFRKQQDSLALNVIAQKGIDPMILLDTSLFILACGLLFLRIANYLILLIYRIGQKKFGPALYASFLQLKRTWYQGGFLAVFLIMTIAGGIFDANMARTMNGNMEERIRYNIGSDIRMEEQWKVTILYKAQAYHWEYKEPDYGIYTDLVKQGICDHVTRVIEDKNTEITANNIIVPQTKLMAIGTKEFGETAKLMDGLNEEHWFYALNALAENPEGVIISKNLAEKLGVKVGDNIKYARNYPIEPMETTKMKTLNGTVCAIVDCFPGYEKYDYEKGEDGKTAEKENYLIVANYATVVSEFGMTPYQIWMDLSDKGTDDMVQNYLEDKGVVCEEWTSLKEQIMQSRNSAMVQVTNGMFTLSFIISLIICSVGFLIYWIMSIKKRELLFGIYRAMGIGQKEINQMLLSEQLFRSVLAIVAGGGVGALTTWLFVQLIAIIYLPKKHNIDIQISIYASDMLKLAVVILLVVLVCYMILRLLLRNMKIAQALRLGED